MKKPIFFLLAVTTAALSAKAQQDTVTIARNLQQIEVSANVVQPTDNHTVIGSKALNQNNTGQNLPYLLSATPSLVTTSDDGLGIGYTYFRVRGTDHTRINMTVNDVPLNDAESQTVFWVNLTDMSSSLSQLNIQRGVGTSTNGSAAFGASVNMSTLPQPNQHRENHVQLAFNGGMYNTFKEMIAAEIVLPNNLWFQGRFSKVNSDGYLERAASDLYSYHAALGYDTHRTKVELSVFGGKEKTYMAWDGVSAADLQTNHRYNPAGEYTDDNGQTAYYDNQTDNYQQQHVQLHLAQQLLPSLWLNATMHYTHGGGYYEQYKADKKFSSFGLEPYTNEAGETVKKSDFIRQKHLNNHFYGGVLSFKYVSEPVDAQIGTAINNYNGLHYGNVIYVRDSLYPYNVPLNYEYYRNHGDKFDANVYARANWRIINQARQQLTLYADMQYRYVHYQIGGINDEDLQPIPVEETFNFFNPKAGITYRNCGHQTYFNFAIANREPSRKNYTEAGPYEIPTSERLYDYELGYTYQHERFHAGINLYYMDYDNQLVLTGKYSDTGAYLTRNVKDSYRTGAEISAGVKIVDMPVGTEQRFIFTWEGNITFSHNRILNYTDWVDTYDTDWNDLGQTEINFGNVDIAFSPSITAASVFSFDVAGFRADLQTNVVGKQYLDNTMSEEAMLKAYTVTNLNLQYILPLPKRCPDIALRCQINNLFNARYESNGGNWMCLFEDGHYEYSPWYYAQAGINVHAGFCITF
ncbi:MAG: TonB-dependent receptor plug domain-containing protein [Paludibacter sp.]|nr:TonB-dependent receptor plug domain-containing protein [Bacteroidales bacterium]MCM1069582.1 TonB-dependent receptor plug domain-containing protein [Prevotella sp.]MCM1354228.1 TonB-dependent receptor plug domain-containing protein [Bacteroides sp.]MCM1443033.1 TonB-dependent receptor plug domain-containing protein [Muribaculum sp.]MCM1482302.1 TonB-dependent receptor plug domain-containing protein [Paludibacter sp.]